MFEERERRPGGMDVSMQCSFWGMGERRRWVEVDERGSGQVAHREVTWAAYADRTAAYRQHTGAYTKAVGTHMKNPMGDGNIRLRLPWTRPHTPVSFSLLIRLATSSPHTSVITAHIISFTVTCPTLLLPLGSPTALPARFPENAC